MKTRIAILWIVAPFALWLPPAAAQTTPGSPAGAVHLICRPPPGSPMVVDGTTTVELNEAQGTATVHFAAFSLQGQISPELPARTVGPMNAKFTEETVTFDNPDPNSAPDGGPDEYVLNRLTGELRGKWGEDSEICQVGTKQF